MKRGVKSRLVKSSGDNIRVRLQEENEAGEDPVLGFIANRPVFDKSDDEDSYRGTQWRRVQSILPEGHKNNLFCDLTLVVQDGSISLNSLVAFLIICYSNIIAVWVS